MIPETGENGYGNPPGGPVVWTVAPKRRGGVVAIARTQLRSSLFHEFHHLVRRRGVERTMLEVAISEGMATAFERDSTGAPVPWARYPPEAGAWVEQLRDVPSTAGWKRWRETVFKAGTYLVDRAMCATGKSSADLVSTSAAEVLSLASRAGAKCEPQ